MEEKDLFSPCVVKIFKKIGEKSDFKPIRQLTSHQKYYFSSKFSLLPVYYL